MVPAVSESGQEAPTRDPVIVPNMGTIVPKSGTIPLKHGPYQHPDEYLEMGPAHIACDFCGSFRTYYVFDRVFGHKFGCHACDYKWE